MSDISPLEAALRTLEIEQDGLKALKDALENSLAQPFSQTIKLLGEIKGRVIITGMGKSGHVGAKIAATLASTGTPAHFVHAAEANHGDLGMITKDDAVIALSWSGETSELNGIVQYTKRFSIPLVVMTSAAQSTLASHADIVLALPAQKEACPHNLAPTTSSIMNLAIGDAIAIALLENRSFSAADFSLYHPGGKLGAQLIKVGDIMHKADNIPIVETGTQMTQAIMQISQKGFGCVGVIDKQGKLCGIITDGDLRRNLSTDLLKEKVEDVMSKNPKTIEPDMLAMEALEHLNKSAITALMVAQDSRPVGIVHFHDLLRIGVA